MQSVLMGVIQFLVLSCDTETMAEKREWCVDVHRYTYTVYTVLILN